MIDLHTRRDPLQELVNLLVIPVPLQPLYIPVNKKGATKVEVYPGYYRRYAQVERVESVNEKVELVMPLDTDMGRLFGFTAAVERKLSGYDSRATILNIRRFCDRGTVITMEIKDTELSNIMIKLANMSQVETAGEEPLAITLLPLASFPNNLGGQLTSGVRPSKKIQVILRETDTVRREAAAILN